MSDMTLAEVTARLSDYDPQALKVAQAQYIIKQFLAPIDAPESLAVRNLPGRVLAADIASPINVPSYDNSAMDGYALHGACLQTAGAVTLKIAGAAFAGHAHVGSIQPNECIRIMTGAPMPDGCDTVVPQEFVRQDSATTVTIPAAAVKAGDNRRLKGEDLPAGSTALVKGKILRPADIGLLASLGIAAAPVQRRLRVAFFSTGDELRSVGEALDQGCVYDSNRYTLHAMLSKLGCEVIDLGVIKDDPASLMAALCSACETADAIVTSGGVSAGAADYIRQTVAQMGDVAFWSLAMRPGRPMAFGKISSHEHSAYLFGLPGNPVATMVSFYFFVRDALLQMMGARNISLPLMRVIAQTAIGKKPGRTEYQRGIVASSADGTPQVRITGVQGSGILRSMSEANCLVVLHHEQGSVAAGDPVDVLLFDGLM
jgi:molybdopterin molybdotransferase